MTVSGKSPTDVVGRPRWDGSHLTFLCLLLLLAVIPWSTAGFSIGFGLVILSSLPRLRFAWSRPRHPLLLPTLVWVVALLLSYFWSEGPRAADEARSYYPFLLMFAASSAALDRAQATRLGVVFLATASIAGFLSCCAHIGWIETADDRFSGSVSIFTFAMVMATGYVLCAIYFCSVPDWPRRILLWVASLMMLDGVLMNESRATVLAVIVGILVLFLFLHGRRRRLILFLAPILLAAPIVLPGSGMLDRFQVTAEELNLADDDVHPREILWIAAGRMFQAHPWMGIGVGNYRSERERMFEEGEMEGFILYKEGYETAHSVFLHIAATMGVVGLVAFLFWSGSYVVWFLKRRRRSMPVAVTALALLGIVFAFGLTDMALLNSRITGLLAIGLGVAIGVLRNEEVQV
ncbi:MAG: O-antigen ligase family protein [Planctomycetota bacterium]|jgi:O-antigen ligase